MSSCAIPARLSASLQSTHTVPFLPPPRYPNKPLWGPVLHSFKQPPSPQQVRSQPAWIWHSRYLTKSPDNTRSPFFSVQRLSAHQYSQNLHEYRGSHPPLQPDLHVQFEHAAPSQSISKRRSGFIYITICLQEQSVRENRFNRSSSSFSAHSNRHHQVLIRCYRLESAGIRNLSI